MKTPCVALVTDPPWHLHPRRCAHNGKHVYRGAHVCATHLRTLNKWEEQGRVDIMARHWWHVDLAAPEEDE